MAESDAYLPGGRKVIDDTRIISTTNAPTPPPPAAATTTPSPTSALDDSSRGLLIALPLPAAATPSTTLSPPLVTASAATDGVCTTIYKPSPIFQILMPARPSRKNTVELFSAWLIQANSCVQRPRHTPIETSMVEHIISAG